MSGYKNTIIKSGIYKITCIINNRVYIGSSKDISRRIGEHKSELRLNKHHNRLLQEDYNLYGMDNFKFETVCLCDMQDLLNIEQQVIDDYGGLDSMNNYNLFSTNLKYRGCEAKDNKGPNNPMYNKKHTIKTKNLISKNNSMNRIEICEKVSKTLRGKLLSYNADIISDYRKLYLKTGNIKLVAKMFNKNSATMYYLVKYGCCNKQQHLKYPDIYPNWFDTLNTQQLNDLKLKQKIIRQEVSKKANLVKSKKFNNNTNKFLF